jgi:hypothetical protein
MTTSMHKQFVSLSLVAVLLSFGCMAESARSFRAPIDESVRTSVRSVTVVPADFQPETNVVAFAKGRGEGAGKGAATGAVDGAAYFSAVALSGGPFGAMLMPLMAAFGAATGAVAGGVIGGVQAMSADDARRAEGSVDDAVKDLNIQGRFAGSLAAALPRVAAVRTTVTRDVGPSTRDERPEYRALAGPDAGLVIETSIRDLGFASGKKILDPKISFFMTAFVRVVEPQGGKELYGRTMVFRGPPRTVEQWAQDDAYSLKREFDRAYTALAESITDELFLVHEFRLDPISPADTQCMLRPYASVTTVLSIEPVDPLLPRMGAGQARLRFASVASLQPVLQWESFPRDKDREYDGTGILSRLSKVTYDVRLWKGHDDHPDELIYERSGLVLPEQVRKVRDEPVMQGLEPPVRQERYVEHCIETVLEPGAEYYWTVRARFKLDGRTRVTRWSFSRIPWQNGPDPCVEVLAPPDHYYRFVTPVKE